MIYKLYQRVDCKTQRFVERGGGMSDVNVIITAVDKGMDIMDGYEREVEDLRAHVAFDIHSVIAAVEHEKSFVEQNIDDTQLFFLRGF